MKTEKMFPLNLQIFGDENVEKTPEPTKVEPKKEEVKQPEIDIEKLTLSLTEKIMSQIKAEKDKEINELKSSFEEKFNEVKTESESYAKLIEGLKESKDTKDIIKDIELHNVEAKKSKELKDLIQAKLKAEDEAKKTREEAESLRQLMIENERKDKLKSEKLEFKNKLLEESKDKPYIADKINKILEEEDFEIQKQDYRTILKFFDTTEEKERFEAKKRAGSSAFEGVKTSKDGNSDFDITSYNKKYVESKIKQAEGKRKPRT